MLSHGCLTQQTVNENFVKIKLTKVESFVGRAFVHLKHDRCYGMRLLPCTHDLLFIFLIRVYLKLNSE